MKNNNPIYLQKAATTLGAGIIIFISIMAFKGKSNKIPTVQNETKSMAGMAMTYQEFSAAKTNWKSINPGLNATYGGSISKDAIMEILNTLPPDNQKLVYYFGTDAAGKTFVMFAPPNAGETSKIYRNESYCPSVCN